MYTLRGASARVCKIYELYEEREEARFSNLYSVFFKLAEAVDQSKLEAKLELDYLQLGEAIRSYFLDVIRYKEYHFDPKDPDDITDPVVAEKVRDYLEECGVKSVSELDDLSAARTELVHKTVNLSETKVAAYTAKWLLRNRPISVISTSKGDGEAKTSSGHKPLAAAHPFLTNINEEYVLQCVLLIMGIKAKDVNIRRRDELIYSFRFREFNEAHYFRIFSKDYLCGSGEG